MGWKRKILVLIRSLFNYIETEELAQQLMEKLKKEEKQIDAPKQVSRLQREYECQQCELYRKQVSGYEARLRKHYEMSTGKSPKFYESILRQLVGSVYIEAHNNISVYRSIIAIRFCDRNGKTHQVQYSYSYINSYDNNTYTEQACQELLIMLINNGLNNINNDVW